MYHYYWELGQWMISQPQGDDWYPPVVQSQQWKTLNATEALPRGGGLVVEMLQRLSCWEGESCQKMNVCFRFLQPYLKYHVVSCWFSIYFFSGIPELLHTRIFKERSHFFAATHFWRPRIPTKKRNRPWHRVFTLTWRIEWCHFPCWDVHGI